MILMAMGNGSYSEIGHGIIKNESKEKILFLVVETKPVGLIMQSIRNLSMTLMVMVLLQ